MTAEFYALKGMLLGQIGNYIFFIYNILYHLNYICLFYKL